MSRLPGFFLYKTSLMDKTSDVMVFFFRKNKTISGSKNGVMKNPAMRECLEEQTLETDTLVRPASRKTCE